MKKIKEIKVGSLLGIVIIFALVTLYGVFLYSYLVQTFNTI